MLKRPPVGAAPRRLKARLVLVLGIALLAAPGVTACGSGTHAATAPAVADASTGAMATMGPTSDADALARDAVWSRRPDYVRADARAESAYAFALRVPHVLSWIPCYCGCEGMGHRSNLDCYFKPTMAGLAGAQFEEHASYCQVCVDITLKTKLLLEEGHSLRDIRAAVDQAFGGNAPGTPTDLPPS